MKTSWKSYFRRMAAVLLAGGATAWTAAVGYAQVAADNASNSVYNNGWQAGDDGGIGFGPWNFDGSYDAPPNTIHLVNSSHPKNDLGTAWALSLNYVNGLARAGRSFDAPLQVGQTFSVVVDIPTEHRFYSGYTIRLNSGGGSICYGGAGCTPGTNPVERFAVWMFADEYDLPPPGGQWRVTPGTSPYFIPFYDEDSDQGLRIDFKLTGAESYELKMMGLEPGGMTYTRSGALVNPGMGAINWIEFLHYDERTDPTLATDIYISSMQITGSAATGDFDGDGDKDGADFLRWQRGLGITTGATLGQGDSEGDGDVDSADLMAWKTQFATSVAAASNLPEPASAALALAGVAGVAYLGRKRS